MATAKEVQAELDAQGTNKKIVIVKAQVVPTPGTTTLYYCTGGTVTARAKWCTATTSDNAATQAAAIAAEMVA